ncbi:LysR family transcriptional regulator [Streptomyces dioscori]|uniref:LysR family transcriptional regulator n=1 Tax=Streptomyces dioscori TaxID=2109333 RepID=A0A2P8Q2L6_9ACTN|nr:LysR family transcriptional regulator [Streptomyces dioscori]
MSRRDQLPPLNPTRVFEATGRLLSVTKAADELCVTPAAVSRQVRALEVFLDVKLFNRIHGRLELTPAGARYLADITPLFAALLAATRSVQSSIGNRALLRIRSPATFAVRWLIPRLAGFHQANPTIEVQLSTSSAPLDLKHEDVDAGVQLGDGSWPETHSQQLIANLLVPVTSPSYQRATQLVRSEQLQQEVLLHTMARPDDWALWFEAVGLDTARAYSGMKYETSLLAYQAAIEGHGVAIAQKSLVAKELADGTLVTPIPFELDCGKHTYYFVWSTRRPQPPALSAFCAWLLNVDW